MIARMQSNIKNQKLFTGMIAFAAIFVIAVSVMIGVNVFGGNSATSPIPTEVTLNGKTYSKADPFEILEIVPQRGLGELGYMVGGDSMPILASDISNISNLNNNRTTVLNAWKNCSACVTGQWNDLTIYSDDGLSIVGYEDRNLFANSVFGNSDMSDKLIVKTVSAASVTKADVDEADMVYVNRGYHSSKYYEAYNLMAQYNSKYTSVKTDVNFNNNNFSADVALDIYIKSVKNGMPVVYDDSNMVSDDADKGDNYSKLGILLLGIDPDTFVTEYASKCSTDGIYSGTKGSIGVYNSILQISGYEKWRPDMFVKNNPQYPYFNATADGRNKRYLRNNVLAYYGDNLMDMVFLTGGDNVSDYDSKGNYLGTSFENAKKIFEISGNEKLLYTKMVRYIIGDFPPEKDFTQINVLEIQPCGDYSYNNYDGAVKIAKYFRYDTSKITQANWNDLVNVRSVASNGFNGMNEDLAEKYDLIIIGTNDLNGHMGSPSDYTYSGKGALVNIINLNKKTRYSGNDLTDKSVTKIINYAKTGKPMVLSQNLYFGDSKIDSSAKIYGLSIINLRAKSNDYGKNIIDEPGQNDSFRYLKRLEKPVITVTDNLKVKYQGDIATTTVMADSLSNLDFYGKIGKDAKTYHLTVSVDKNGNGLFSSESKDDTNEVFFNEDITTDSDGSFDVKLNLPDALRGYVAWKAIATDISTQLSSEDLGGFVIQVRADDVKTVNLLQILPATNSKPITLDMSKNDKFKNLFMQAESASGIKLNVTTMTTRQFENMYKNGNKYNNYENDNLLKNYSMIVFGFADSYGLDDISNNNGALNNLYDYIEQGNSVLFVHDTMSYCAYSDGSTDRYGNKIYNAGEIINPNGTGGYELTSKFKYRIGMDRYGSSEGNASGSDYVQGYSNEFLIKYGRTTDSKGKSISYSMFNNIKPYTSDVITDSVNQLNRGQVTEFPYNIPQSLSISQTHAQWFQLDLESQSDKTDDVVVWYTLGSTDTSGLSNSVYYDYTGQDALNGYYIYSKGNVTYTGAGHSNVQETSELKLFVNTVIRAILSGNSAPEIKVTNAARVSDGKYDLYTSDNTKLPEVDFTAVDADLSKNTGTFKSGLVYWDVDGNGSYNTGDVTLEEYNSTNVLRNAAPITIDLQNPNYSNRKNANGDTLQTYYNDKKLKIGIQATDSTNATGSATVSVMYRRLFYLD